MTVHVSDDGNDLTFKWVGTMDLSDTPATNNFSDSLDRMLYQSGGVNVFYSAGGPLHGAQGAGNFSTNALNAAAGYSATTNGTGLSFGYSGQRIQWDQAYGIDPGMIEVDREFTMVGQTIAGRFGNQLDNGPIVLWTHTASGDTISITSEPFVGVPEPSSAVVLGLASIAGCFPRRRRS